MKTINPYLIFNGNAEEAEEIYNKLSEGGTIFMPLEETDWAEMFAMFVDKFGIQWIINYGDKG